ncbi:MAG TPA: hypothetical protein VEZ52_00480 [Desulfovibrio sp.]|uniref:hypothetical protein n=1 Tax=Desulfovibrio sp. TaxID=885 RepID=UPI002D268380|nr:hypothetical protein [Desulfovibrio sp.]HZF60074.1 hypothetical protein [Desulfovibrio sp.]
MNPASAECVNSQKTEQMAASGGKGGHAVFKKSEWQKDVTEIWKLKTYSNKPTPNICSKQVHDPIL